MIFVVCGTQKFPLNRLLEAVDELVAKGKIQEDVLVQKGYSDYHLKHCRSVDFLDVLSFDNQIKACSLVITHGGIGTILAGKKFNKPVLVFPRLKKYGEHVDDHQEQIAEKFAANKMVVMCNDTKKLEACIKKCRSCKLANISQKNRGKYLEEVINGYIDKWIREGRKKHI